MLKKFSLLSIIFILAFSQVGYYFVLRQSQERQKEIIKQTILSQLKDEELDIISLNNNQQKIYWEEDGKEFLFNGEMYDVVKSKTVNGKILLYCINDKKEKALVDRYNSITKHNSSSDKKSKTIDNSITLFFQEKENADNVGDKKLIKYFFSYKSPLPQNLMDKNYPPPKA